MRNIVTGRLLNVVKSQSYESHFVNFIISDMTHHDRPQVTTIIDHGHCCAYNGQYYKVGENVPIPSKCLWLQCK